MSTHEPIIDINPVAAARDKAGDAVKKAASDGFQAPSFGKKAARAAAGATGEAKGAAQTVAHATVIGKNGKPAKKPNRVGGAVQTVAGGALMLVGVPMLILPGPGLVAIGGGAALAVSGVKKMLGK